MEKIPFDYKELWKILNKHKVKYLVIGAYAVIYYTEPRYTKDLDISIEPSPTNAEKVFAALKEFGAPLGNISVEDFANPNLVYQMGVAPVRVDIIMGTQGTDFNEAWKNKKEIFIDNIKVNMIGIKDLIKMKEKANREMDRRDLKELKYSLKKKRR